MILFYLAVSILAIQILFWLIWWIAFTKDEGRQSDMREWPPVSIIVCAHDEEANLRALVPTLLQQEYPEFEVIIVEDRSNDQSYDLLLSLTATNPKLRMVRVTQTPDYINGKKFAITLGVKAARYEWLLFTDADCRPVSAHWIRQMAQHFHSERKFVLAYSPYKRYPGVVNSFIRFEALVTAIQYLGFARIGMPYMGVGRNLAYRKSLFLEKKGFNNYLHVTGGDDDLFVNRHANQTNAAVALGELALVRSEPKRTWGDYFYQKVRHLSVGKRYALRDKLILGLFSASWMLTWLVVPILTILSGHYAWVAVSWLVRWIMMGVTLESATRKLGEPFESWKMPFLDFIYPFYYLVVGTFASVSKKVRWKKN